MRALTVRQPWAWAIIHGGKDVENRTRNVAGSYRGPVAIHAGLVFDAAALRDPTLREALPRDATGAKDAFYDRHMLGRFVGVADLVDVHHADWCWEPEGHCSRWGQELHHHLVLADPRPLETPIPARGMLGLWTPPPAVLEQLQAVTR